MEPGETQFDSWLPYFIQTTDPQFPTGAYAHSFALEELVALGKVRNAEDLAEFLRIEMAEQLAHLELPGLRFAREAAQAGDLNGLYALDAELDALLLPQEARATSAKLGRQRLKLLNNLYPTDLVTAYHKAERAGETAAHQAVVAGLQSTLWPMPLRAALWAQLYQVYAQTLQASMKLIRIGQERCQMLLRDALGQADFIIEESLLVTPDVWGCSLPLPDLAASRHATAFSRLFIS